MSPTRVVSNLFKLHRGEYIAPRVPRVLSIGDAKYISIQGSGSLSGEAINTQSRALRQLVTTLRDILMTRHRDFTGTKLECIWQEGACPTAATTDWKLCMRVPEFVAHEDIHSAIHAVLELSGTAREKIESIFLENLPGSTCLQTLHRGTYDTVPRSVEALQRYAESAHLALSTTRHAIYLSEPRHVPPEHLRTILRIPLCVSEMAALLEPALEPGVVPERSSNGWPSG